MSEAFGTVTPGGELWMRGEVGRVMQGPASTEVSRAPASIPPALRRFQRIRQILADTAAITGVSVEEIKGQSRRRGAAMARHAAIRQIAAEFPRLSLSELGRMFGRDHTTIGYILGRFPKNGRRWDEKKHWRNQNGRGVIV
jgi:Bacterial dnaA protein helix-turn-helix